MNQLLYFNKHYQLLINHCLLALSDTFVSSFKGAFLYFYLFKITIETIRQENKYCSGLYSMIFHPIMRLFSSSLS